jgi:hypothetical protein
MKPACIKCKRPVGTIFTRKNNHYIAICGDATNPCPLSIDIYHGTPNDLYEILTIFEESILNIKDSIIQQKLDTAFDYLNEFESIQLFKEKMSDYNLDNSIYNEYLSKYKYLYSNVENETAIREKKENIYKMIEENREILKEYKRTENKELLKTAMRLQVNEIEPEILKLRSMANKVMEIVSHEKENVVFTYPVALSSLAYNSKEKAIVVDWKV